MINVFERERQIDRACAAQSPEMLPDRKKPKNNSAQKLKERAQRDFRKANGT